MSQTLEAADLLADFRRRRDDGSLDSAEVERKALRAAELVISRGREQGGDLRDAVTLLCEIASSEDPERARAGVRALFQELIERLNDSFDPAACLLYDRIFSQVIDYYRRLPQAREFDETLRGFGLMNEFDLLDRKSVIRDNREAVLYPRSSISKVLLLSRVTIGADVAVTSVIISRLRDLLPEAEFVLFGPAKLRELFGGDRRVRILEIAYERGGGVMSRLASWIDLVEAVNNEIKGLNPNEFWLIDPDSRLTQLGLLPLLKNESSYLFFESRSYRGPQGEDKDDPQSRTQAQRSIGHLTSHWIDEILGARGEAYPYVALPDEHLRFGRSVAGALRGAGASNIIAISLGVGGNQNKRVSEEFEIEMINRLIAGSTLILDKGATAEERDQIDRIVDGLRAAGRVVVEINEANRAGSMSQEKIRADAITWDGGIGAFAGLVAASDRYIGYDSAGQHIAAALRVPTLTIFINTSSPTFAERWRPYGPGVIEVFNVISTSS